MSSIGAGHAHRPDGVLGNQGGAARAGAHGHEVGSHRVQPAYQVMARGGHHDHGRLAFGQVEEQAAHRCGFLGLAAQAVLAKAGVGRFGGPGTRRPPLDLV